MKPKDAAKAANVNYNTARKWKQAYNNDPEKNIPLKKTNRTSNRPVSQLNGAHKEHLIKFFDEDVSATIQDATEDLIKSFAGLEIKKSRVAEFMKEECNLSLKVSGFDINMRRSRGWSAKGSAAIVETPSTKANSQTVVGAISAFGVVNLTMRESGNIKRRKVVGATKRKAPEDRISVPKGTTSGHYTQFISDTMDIMDEFPEMRGFHIIMDNAPIHVPSIIDPVIIRRGYIPVYLPPYSPELNPIEQFWAVLKSKVKRTKLSDIETLRSRIIEASEAIPVEHLQNFIQHSVNQFGNCLNKNPI
ncbi:hypothetical protein RO3G_13026 [Rhizopus delemar RA 99-880]|uniref:Tc1-like transposase DDE domain-containing protein n=1 Tax=Rhizopus delemar (strain RA 99-880 / ATCC MYA-4621 / FGSC 9543 / NRRL 43880) TaxID=246409 RepID=I1CIN5_RHIO9|nr:hypothetical protein RO3G_13026 [Rhizopus delemar RA 99-880]|eukprot:EIE88315.1 hypothetical protein RO3G_13026 [Rhizopus delemar RA 99-880]